MYTLGGIKIIFSFFSIRNDPGSRQTVNMGKSLSLNEIRTRCAQLAIDWRDSAGDERQEAQSFVRDLLTAYGISETKAALYEKRVQKSSTGGRGYIDALIPGLLLVEMKSAGKDLRAAEIQALDYIQHLEDAEVPKYVLTSDFRRFRLLTMDQSKESDVIEFDLADLPRNAELLGVLAGYESHVFGSEEQEQASIRAAQIMAELYESLGDSSFTDHEASVFLVRTLFTLYADDSGLWPRDLFIEYLRTRTSPDGSDLGPQLSMLFQVMNQPLDQRHKNLDEVLSRFPYVNGGVFSEPLKIPIFTKKMRDKLIDASSFNWANISPAIFGSLFQAVKSVEARRELGEHYTTERNILKTIGPLFLDDVNSSFESAKNDPAKLRKLLTQIGKIVIFDPACGCGNFLVIAYRELRAIELKISLTLQKLGDKTNVPTLYFERENLAVQLQNIQGIEIEEWPARIAQTALLLTEHQANSEMEKALGKAPDTLPLEEVAGIRIENALRQNWLDLVPEGKQVMIVGNPPFSGISMMNSAQQSDNRLVFESIDAVGRQTGRLDYVACWYAKAIDFIQARPDTRAALVSTNSITQGEQARTMLPLLLDNGIAIDFAHQSFKWTSEAPGRAAVHCVIIGFSAKSRPGRQRILFTYPSLISDPISRKVDNLNFYLVDGPDLVPEKLTKPKNSEMPACHKGSQPTDGQYLLVDEDAISAVRADPIAAKFLRRFVQGQDMLQDHQKRWCLWLKDATPQELRASKIISSRLVGVRNSRLLSPTDSVREMALTPWLFTQDRQPTGRYFALPEVSSENRIWIPGRFFDAQVIAGNKLIVFPDATDWQSALLQSSMFMAWVFRFAGRLKSDISISPALAYFPIPWPKIDELGKAKLERAIRLIFEVRAKFDSSSLADLYSPLSMPGQLLIAHKELDSLVDTLFTQGAKLSSNEDRLQVLLEIYSRVSP